MGEIEIEKWGERKEKTFMERKGKREKTKPKSSVNTRRRGYRGKWHRYEKMKEKEKRKELVTGDS